MIQSRRLSLDISEPVFAIESIEFKAKPDQLGAIHDLLATFWNKLPASGLTMPDEAWKIQFGTSVAEIANNIIQHAYVDGTRKASFWLDLVAYTNKVEARFLDQGVPFAGIRWDGPNGDANQPLGLSESGRGLSIARAWLDKVDYFHTPQGNRWCLMKFL